MTRAEEYLGRTVPQSDNLVGVCPERDAKRPSKAKVSEFEVAVLVNEKVLWLEVAMEDTMCVAEEDASD